MRSIVAATCLVALLAGGCKKADGLIVVTVESSESLPTVTLLNATVTAAGRTGSFNLGPASATGVTFPQTFGIDIAPAFAGQVTIKVDALDSMRAIVDSGSTMAVAEDGKKTDAIITIGEVFTSDGGTDACHPRTCSDAGLVCGKADDQCGGTLNCGPCMVTALHESIARVGDTVFIEGVFNSDLTVTFPGGTAATPTVLGANRASVVVPTGASSGGLTITSGTTQSAAVSFRITTAAPGLQSLGPAAQTTTARESPTLTLPRLSHASVQIPPFLYVVGGSNSGYLGDLRRSLINADGTLGQFGDPGVQLVTPRSAHSLFLSPKYLYVIGGFGQAGTRDWSVRRSTLIRRSARSWR